MGNVKVKGKDLLYLLENSISEIKTTCGKTITIKDVRIDKLSEILKPRK